MDVALWCYKWMGWDWMDFRLEIHPFHILAGQGDKGLIMVLMMKFQSREALNQLGLGLNESVPQSRSHYHILRATTL